MYSCDGDVESNSVQINCPLLDLAATEFLPGGPSSRGEGWGEVNGGEQAIDTPRDAGTGLQQGREMHTTSS